MRFTPRLRQCKRTHKCVLASVIAIILFCLYQTEILTKPVFYLFLSDNHDVPCSIPVVDPFDVSLQKYIWKPEPLVCDSTPSIVFLDDNNILHLNKSAFIYFHVNSEEDISCTAQSVSRTIDDYHFLLGDAYILQFPGKLRSEFNVVQCKHGDTMVFDKILVCVRGERGTNQPSIEPESDDQLSVHMIGLDSVSRSASIRGLPKTLAYLQTLGSYDFRGTMKIGENTPPNLIGLLTGRLFNTHETTLGGHVDQLPFLWKDFAANNYATLYAEDNSETSMVNMELLRGFADVPTDHYMRPFWLATKERRSQRWTEKILKAFNVKYRFCEQGTKISILTLNYLKQFMMRYDQGRKFSFTFLSDVSHVSSNYLPFIDDEIKDFLQWMKADGFMKKSVVILFGDHGTRFDSLRNTFAGRIESRMPMLHVILPEHIKTRFPEVDVILKTNTQRLVTHFDVYQTVLDILNNNFGNPSTQIINGKPRGVSLFQQLSRSRSCKEANIPTQFCACYNSEAIDLSNTNAVNSATEDLVDHINRLLTDEPKCQTLKLNRILLASKMSLGLVYKETLEIEGSSLLRFFKPEKARESYNIVIETKPGLATFDVLCELDSEGRAKRVVNVDRTNAYGNQSYCVTNKTLKQLCYC